MYNMAFFTTSRLLAAGVLLLCLALCTGGGLAETIEQEARSIQEKYTDISSLQFAFDQQTMNAGRIRQGMGDAVLLRKPAPDNANEAMRTIMRWNYHYPVEQVILNTGKEISIYTEEDKQLIITAAEQMESDITFALFSGRINIIDAFTVSPGFQGRQAEEEGSPLTSLILIPKENHPQLQRLHLWYTPDYLIRKLVMEDHFGSVTTITLKNIKLDGIDGGDSKQVAAVLKLDLPEDTEIIRQ